MAVQMEAHAGDVYCLKWSPSAQFLASAGRDKLVYVWDIEGGYRVAGSCKGHKNAILDLKWPTEDRLLTASADKSALLWDTFDFSRIRSFAKHDSHVNSIDSFEQN
jgi:Prp8 binding protein